MDSETACCATPEGGAQCVPDTDQSECTPPQGVCENEVFADDVFVGGGSHWAGF